MHDSFKVLHSFKIRNMSFSSESRTQDEVFAVYSCSSRQMDIPSPDIGVEFGSLDTRAQKAVFLQIQLAVHIVEVSS